jgi:hypothetical protein
MRIFLWFAGIAAAFGLRLPQATMATLREGYDQAQEFDRDHPEIRDGGARGFNLVQSLAKWGAVGLFTALVPPVIGLTIARYSPSETLGFICLTASIGLALLGLATCFLCWGPLFWGVKLVQSGARRAGNWMDAAPRTPISIKPAAPAAPPTGGKP